MLGRYELLEEIASGGMATVYLGRAVGVAGFQRLVAIKCCHAHLRRDPAFVNMFLDEARLAAQIRHPNVVATLDIAHDDDELYLVMEYVEGGRLADVLAAAHARREPVPVAVALRVLIDALSGLDAAHELAGPDGESLGIVHRDVSPQNILVGLDGVARIADFGVAKARSELRAQVTDEGTLKGKLAYMAPEQVSMHVVTRQIDVWAAGVVLWETLTGQRLFAATSDAMLLDRVLNAPIAKPSSVRGDLPPGLDEAALRALERNPLERYATAAEFIEALEGLPVAPATAREMRAYARDALGEISARHQAALRDAGTTIPPRASSPSLPSPSTRVARREATADAAHELLTAEAPPTVPSLRTRARAAGPRAAVATAALVALGLFGGAWMRRAHSRAPSTASAPPPASSAPRVAATPPERPLAPSTARATAPDSPSGAAADQAATPPPHASGSPRHPRRNGAQPSSPPPTPAPTPASASSHGGRHTDAGAGGGADAFFHPTVL